jgi:hypothetical protein
MAYLRIAQHGILPGKAEVAMQCQGHAHADAVAMQRRDHRLVERNADTGDRPQQRVGRHHAPGAVDLLDVGARTKCFVAGTGEQGDADAGIIRYFLPDRAEPFLRRHIERIEHLRPIERNDCDPVRALLQKNRHCITLRHNPRSSSRTGHFRLIKAWRMTRRHDETWVERCDELVGARRASPLRTGDLVGATHASPLHGE